MSRSTSRSVLLNPWSPSALAPIQAPINPRFLALVDPASDFSPGVYNPRSLLKLLILTHYGREGMPVKHQNQVSIATLRPLVLAALFLVGGFLHAAPLAISWHGQSFFEVVTSSGARLVIDPHAIENYGRRSVKADVVLLSHRHTDHNRLEAIENATQAKVLEGLKAAGPGGRGVFNPVDEKIKDIRVRNIACFHDTVQGMKRGLNSIWVIEADGLRIAHLGDLGHTLDAAQLRELGNVDVVMVPVGGVYTLNGLDAKKVVEQIKPTRFTIPMHYGTRVYSDLLGPDAFLGEFEEAQIQRVKGNSIQVDASQKAGAMKVEVLGFEPAAVP